MTMQTVSKFDLSEPDSVRLVVNTAVMAAPNVPGLRVATARREGVAGVYIWIPNYTWRNGQIVTAADELAPEGIKGDADGSANTPVVVGQDA